MSEIRRCFHCGVTAPNTEYEYYRMRTIKDVYAICDNKFMCKGCGSVADSFVNFYGEKPKKVTDKLFNYLRQSVEVKGEFSALMNAGYY